jgi:anti-sigma B factor antagonist
MEIIQEKENDIFHIIIKGRLDSESAPEANRIIKEIVGKKKIRLLFNICDLEYLSSDGLRVILQTAKEVYKKKGKSYCAAQMKGCERFLSPLNL